MAAGRPCGGGGGGNGGNAGDFLVNQSGGITTTNAAGLNYSNSWNKKTELSASYFFNRANNTLSATPSASTPTRPAPPTTRTPPPTASTPTTASTCAWSTRLTRPTPFCSGRASATSRTRPTSALDGLTRRGANASRATSPAPTTPNNNGLNTGGDLLLRHRFAKPGRTASLSMGGTYNQRNGNTTLHTTDTGSPSTTSTSQHPHQNGGSINANLALTEP